jgi:hypothetical protein
MDLIFHILKSLFMVLIFHMFTQQKEAPSFGIQVTGHDDRKVALDYMAPVRQTLTA